MLTLYVIYIFYISYVFLYFFIVVMENPNLEKDSILTNENKNPDSDVCEKSLFDVLSEKWDTERLKETDTVDNLIASFTVDYGSEKMLRVWIRNGSEETSICSFAEELVYIKKKLIEKKAEAELIGMIDKVMDSVSNYVLYGASNRTEPEEK